MKGICVNSQEKRPIVRQELETHGMVGGHGFFSGSYVEEEPL